jgi:ribosomal-protein-alanine N-acetyltransferase
MSGALSTVEIVRGSADHLDEAMTVMREAFDPAYGEAWTRAQCSGILGLSGVWLYVARVDGRPAGFALARAILDEGELLLLAVSPAERRRGVGRAMLGAVLDETRRRGAIRLHLEMRENNDAIALYAAAGFVEVGRRLRYYRGNDGKSFDAITLACPIARDETL